jgi:peroxiredoxin
MGTPIIDFKLPGTDGKMHSPADYATAKILVVIFMCNHCPYIKATIDRMIAIQKDYSAKGVQLIGINANDAIKYPDDSFESMQAWVKEKGINFPYLQDESQAVARAYQAQCTPDIFVFSTLRGDTLRTLAYHGRIDDNWKEPEKATSHDLREALDTLLEGREVYTPQHPSMGCSIKWKE